MTLNWCRPPLFSFNRSCTSVSKVELVQTNSNSWFRWRQKKGQMRSYPFSCLIHKLPFQPHICALHLKVSSNLLCHRPDMFSISWGNVLNIRAIFLLAAYEPHSSFKQNKVLGMFPLLKVDNRSDSWLSSFSLSCPCRRAVFTDDYTFLALK